jgi:hypothetical protein
MLNVLKPVRLPVEALSNHDTDLLTREGIFLMFFQYFGKTLFCFEKTLEMNSLNVGIKS